jgi:pantetheine-phosphate adenylyltransferase
MKTAIYPGTFDPITYGHIDVVERAAKLFHHVLLGVAPNAGKQPFFTLQERLQLASEALQHLENVRPIAIEGLTVDFAQKHDCVAIVRGLRAVSDFEYEFQLAQMNSHLNDQIDTVFLVPSDEQFYTSSNIVKAVAAYDVERLKKFAPPHVLHALRERVLSQPLKP